MTRVAVEFPIREAEALLKRSSDDSMSAIECDDAQNGRERLKRAVAVERGAGGNAEDSVEDQARALVGQDVRTRIVGAPHPLRNIDG